MAQRYNFYNSYQNKKDKLMINEDFFRKTLKAKIKVLNLQRD